MTSTQLHWKSKDGLKLYAKSWKASNPIALIALVHGMGEHINRYDHLANYYNQQGFSVLGFDHRGHGQSEGKRGHTPAYENYMQDLDVFLAQAKELFPELPIVLYGHSMGGNVVLNYLLRRKPSVQAVVTTGPWIKLAFEPNPILVAIGKALRNLAPGFTQSSGLNPAHIALNKAIVKAYVNDPLVHAKISSAAGIDIMKAGNWLLEQKGEMETPCLIMHGSEDKITSANASKQFFEQFSGNISYKSWEGLYHEIHNEEVRETIYQYTIDWLNAQLGR